ncbi:MAG: methylmalonyl Co-A mutase-associated GTPase MeaB [Hyphomicrobiaceae bacterium]
MPRALFTLILGPMTSMIPKAQTPTDSERAVATTGRGPSVAELAAGVRAGNRAMLARAITLVESGRAGDQDRARALLQALLPASNNAQRIGITGVPGVGKSTTIDQLGMTLIAAGHKVAVLAVDPTSKRSGGSILGDKTRMQRLSQSPSAFIRPSPTSGTLGGVARRTRETMTLVEAAGFDVVIVETVGVGQSETTVAEMVDFFLVLLLAGGGDDLQGIKKGVIELADMIAINKADGDNVERATRAAAEYRGALNILTPASPNWLPPVLTISGQENTGLDELWRQIEEHKRIMTASGEREARRSRQAVSWMHDMLADRLMDLVRRDPHLSRRMPELEADVAAGRLTPGNAVAEILSRLPHALPDGAMATGPPAG